MVQKNVEKNIVYISKNYHSGDKKRDHCTVRDFNWIGYEPQLNTPLSLKAKVRHGERFYDAIAPFSDLKIGTIKLDASDQGLAPGQFVALYDGEYCVGSGMQTRSSA